MLGGGASGRCAGGHGSWVVGAGDMQCWAVTLRARVCERWGWGSRVRAESTWCWAVVGRGRAVTELEVDNVFRRQLSFRDCEKVERRWLR